jgi:hypothetical protein
MVHFLPHLNLINYKLRIMAWFDWITKKEPLNPGERWWIGITGNLYKKLSGNGRKGKTGGFWKKK